MKKILIILGSLSIGGAQSMILELCKSIDKTKYEISVLCYEGKTESAIEKETEMVANVVFINAGGKIGLSTYKKVFGAINNLNPDIIHAHLGGMIFAIPWSLLRGKPLMVTAHTTPQKAFNKKIEWLLRLMLKFRKRTMVVAVSKENNADMLKYLSIDESKCKYINNGIDVDKFFRKPHENFTFINVARQDENKNQISIIRAFYRLYRENCNLRLILAGDGPMHGELTNNVKMLGLESVVSLPGMISDVENYYSVSDVYVQSSFREALPLSVLEAMAAGLPIISTDVGGLRDVIDGNGTLIPAGDDDALYIAMKECLYNSKEKNNEMSRTSLSRVEEYSSRKMAEGYALLYDELTR